MKKLASRDRMERLDAVRELIKRYADLGRIPLASLRRVLGYRIANWKKTCRDGESAGVRLGDLAVIVQRLDEQEAGLGGRFADEILAAVGYAVVRRSKSSRSIDRQRAACAAIKECSEVGASAMSAEDDGQVTPSEARSVRDEIRQARDALNVLDSFYESIEAGEMAAVTPIGVSRR